MWRGEKTVSERMKIKFRLHRREHCLRANKKKDEKMTCRCSLTGSWTVPHLPDGRCSFSVPVLLQALHCRCPISTLKTIIGLLEGGHSTESANKGGRLPVTECGDSWGEGYRKKRKKGGQWKEWVNHFKNGNLMTVKLLINSSDTGTVCVSTRTCALASVCPLSLREYKTSHSKSRL